MDSDLWKTLSSFDLLHSEYEWSSIIWSYWKHDAVLSITIVPRVRLHWRPWRLDVVSDEILDVFDYRKFVPVNWMCKKQTSVSHDSTKSEVISLDAELRMDGMSALDLRDLRDEIKIPTRTSSLIPTRRDTITKIMMSCLMRIPLSQA